MTSESEEWPSGRTENLIIDCGESGHLSLKISESDGGFDLAKRNFQAILDKWPSLWPEILIVVQTMLHFYEYPFKVESPLASLILDLPSEDICEGVIWSVAVEFSGHDGVWDVPMDGWSIVSEDAQPYF